MEFVPNFTRSSKHRCLIQNAFAAFATRLRTRRRVNKDDVLWRCSLDAPAASLDATIPEPDVQLGKALLRKNVRRGAASASMAKPKIRVIEKIGDAPFEVRVSGAESAQEEFFKWNPT